MVRTFSTALLSLFIFITVANAFDRQRWKPVIMENDVCLMVRPTVLMLDEYVQQVSRRTPKTKILTLKDSDAIAYMRELNRLPPATRYPAPKTLVITLVPDASRYGISGFGKSGCLTNVGSVKNRIHKIVIDKIKGEPA